jgi:hypothetical protein
MIWAYIHGPKIRREKDDHMKIIGMVSDEKEAMEVEAIAMIFEIGQKVQELSEKMEIIDFNKWLFEYFQIIYINIIK